jgi:hypothetical protein
MTPLTPPPVYIPTQVCDSVGKDPASTPVDACMSLVLLDVRDDGVSASTPETAAPGDPELAKQIATRNAELKQVVTDAEGKGIDLKIVVLDENPGIDTPLRDVATEVGAQFPGSTVLALSPNLVGSYSSTFDRVTLEAGQDVAKVPGNPVQSSKNFLSELDTAHFPWTPFTIVLVVLVAVAAVATRTLQVRARRRDAAEPTTAPSE